MALIARAEAVFEQFTDFPALVYEQVTGLIDTLENSTQAWLGRIYQPHYNGGPSLRGFDPAQERGVGLRAGTAEMNVPAHQIMNASHLRACVWAFLFSLWEHTRKRSGGLDCFLLDDPQTHFDRMNAENFAAAIPMMPEHGMRPIVTSNDNHFLEAIKANLPHSSHETPTWTALLLNPISSSRLTATVSPMVEEIYERRKELLADENNVSKAQSFVERVRIFIENRLWDLLAGDPHVLYKPTLSDLLNALRRCRNMGEPPFAERPFEILLEHRSLKDTARFYTVVNDAHHQLTRVAPADAKEVSDQFNDVENVLRSCTATYARFMGRLLRQDTELLDAGIEDPAPILLTAAATPILGQVSALSSASMVAQLNDAETLDLRTLGDVALYGVRGHSLGILALQGQVVIASLTQQARDGDPVVALVGEKIHIRRYWPDHRDDSRIVLASDLSGSEKVPPALIVPRGRARVLPIVGVLYENLAFAGSSDGCSVDDSPILRTRMVAAHVSEDSAYPVIRDGDTVLLEARTTASEAMSFGEIAVIVALTHGNRFAYLKRAGKTIGPGLRIFDNVGTIGEALVLAEPGSDAASKGMPTIESMWRVCGVIRGRQRAP